jgi:hypothetical protein
VRMRRSRYDQYPSVTTDATCDIASRRPAAVRVIVPWPAGADAASERAP